MDSPAFVEPKRLSDQEARRVLAEHSALIYMVINRWFKSYKRKEEDDLVAVGRASLLEAWARWDPDRGAFSTIATLRIRQRLARWVRRDRDTEQRRAEARTQLIDPFELYASSTLDHAIGGKALGFPSDLVTVFEAEDHVDRTRRLEWLRQVMDTVLTERQREVMVLVFEGLTFNVVGERLGISKQGAEQAFEAAAMRLRRAAVRRRLV